MCEENCKYHKKSGRSVRIRLVWEIFMKEKEVLTEL